MKKFVLILVTFCLILAMLGIAQAQEVYKVTFHEDWVPVLDATPMAKFSFDGGQNWTNWLSHVDEDENGNYYWALGIEPTDWIVLCPAYLDPVDPETQTVQQDGETHSFPWQVIDLR